jgi:hypothetical protein
VQNEKPPIVTVAVRVAAVLLDKITFVTIAVFDAGTAYAIEVLKRALVA